MGSLKVCCRKCKAKGEIGDFEIASFTEYDGRGVRVKKVAVGFCWYCNVCVAKENEGGSDE